MPTAVGWTSHFVARATPVSDKPLCGAGPVQTTRVNHPGEETAAGSFWVGSMYNSPWAAQGGRQREYQTKQASGHHACAPVLTASIRCVKRTSKSRARKSEQRDKRRHGVPRTRGGRAGTNARIHAQGRPTAPGYTGDDGYANRGEGVGTTQAATRTRCRHQAAETGRRGGCVGTEGRGRRSRAIRPVSARAGASC